MKKSTPAWRLPGVVLSVVLVLLGASACSSGGDATPAEKAEAERSAGAAAQPVDMEHIHGIGIDPGSGAVYAGTHYGLFRIEDGTPTRIADRVQDFMGFTVAGPDHFLASGHPGEGQEGPGSVGLIESTDGGQTWQELSLGGQADFHALEYRHDQVYGLDSMSGRLLVSEDKESWQELSSPPIADFAVSPEDEGVITATTQEGLVHSTDGGRTFEAVPDAPLMVFVGWAEDGTLAGVTPDGVLHSAEEPGGEWTQRGDIGGQPEAFTVHSADEIYAATGGTVLISTDGGDTFGPAISQ